MTLWRLTFRPGPRAAHFALALALASLAGCAGLSGGGSLSGPQLPPDDGLLENAELQGVVDEQVQRNGLGLQELLDSPDARIKGRAALALASVQDATAAPALERALFDTAPEVRRNAAFALGQLALPDGGQLLLQALGEEADPEARSRIIEALGKRGGTEAVAALVERVPTPEEEPTWTLALARAALREVRPTGLMEALLERLTHVAEPVRRRAAYYFGRPANTSAWTDFAPRLREALDGYLPGEAAAMDLVGALGRLGEVEEDAARLGRWIVSAEDWRTRVNAAGAVMSPRWLESQEIQDALVLALDDPSEHVRVAAAGSLSLLMWSSAEYLGRGTEWIEGPVEDWREQVPFLSPVSGQGSPEAVLAWTRRMRDVHPAAVAQGVQALGGLVTAEVTSFLTELVEHPDALVRAAALGSLSQRWGRGVAGDEPASTFFELFSRGVADSNNLVASRAAAALTHPAFASLGAEQVLEEAFLARRSDGDVNILAPLVGSLGSSSVTLLREIAEDPDLTLRTAAARTLERLTGEEVSISGGGDENPVTPVDWEALGDLGPRPRVRMETERGEIVLRLFTYQAPLTVQTFVNEVRRGSHDGTRFHRVVTNFVVQGGDFGMGDGSGGPGYRIRSEFTQLPFERGVLGMASAGKDTEGSQYYLTHSMQPHLDGGYTAFGWVEEGLEVLDLLQQGDLVVRMTLLD